MKWDNWIETLLELRRQHVSQVRAFYTNEANILANLNRLYRLELAELTCPLNYAKKVNDHICELKQLGVERIQRYQAVRKRQSEEVYNLLRCKSLAGQ